MLFSYLTQWLTRFQPVTVSLGPSRREFGPPRGFAAVRPSGPRGVPSAESGAPDQPEQPRSKLVDDSDFAFWYTTVRGI